MEEETWFKGAGAIIGGLTCVGALLLDIYSARDRKARLCCCLMLYFGIGMIATGIGESKEGMEAASVILAQCVPNWRISGTGS